MSYTVEFSPLARRNVRSLPRHIRPQILAAIDALASNPRPANCKKMVGEIDTWRLKVGDYRVVYKIQDEQLLIFIVRTAHRRDVYRRK